MISSLILAITATLEPSGVFAAVHTPHSVVSSTAIGPRTSGEMEMVIISRGDARVMSSLDGGYSFQPVAGDGLGKVEAHRVVYYQVPSTGEPIFVIATNRGCWKYRPDTGEVKNISTGLDPVKTYMTDLAAPLVGQDAPIFSVNNWGQIFELDELTDSWTMVADAARFDENAVIAMSPTFDRAAGAGANQTVAVGVRGLLVFSTDAGATWAGHPQFSTPAQDIYEYHVTALEFDHDYQNNGLVMLGRGKRDDTLLYETEGEMWRSSDYLGNFTQLSILGGTTLSSGVYSLVHAGTGPDAADHWYATVYRFPEQDDYDAGRDTIGILHSTDGGLTWDDQGSFQEFIQEFSGNDRTAVGLPYRRMMQIVAHPEFGQNGELWVARAEGLYYSGDLGSGWEKRRFRPSTQVRAIDSQMNEFGQIETWGASYGSGLYRFNHATGESETLPGDGIIYYASVKASPNISQDGLVMGGGQRDLGIRLSDPTPANRQRWFSVNAIRSAIDGDTGYVRTLAFSPRFGGNNVPGGEPIFAWSSRFGDTPLGETRITFDGLANVYLINDVFGQPGDRAPYFHEMDIAQSFDPVNLPYEMDVYGATSAFNEIYRLLNTGTQAAPVFEWTTINQAFEGTLIDVQADPRFDRAQGTATLWALSTEKLYRLDEQSSDWSSFTTTEWPGIQDYLVVDMELAPDMDLAPAVYAATWGGGVFKMDLTDSSPSWEQVGGPPPSVWTECISLSPDFANDRLIFIGTQRGMYAVEDRPGAEWEKLNQDIFYDSANTSFDGFSPLDPANPDPARPWGWQALKKELIPESVLKHITILGESILASSMTGDYCEATFQVGSQLALRTYRGPQMGEVRVTCWDAETGSSAAPFYDVTLDLFQNQVADHEFVIPVPQPGIYTFRLEATNLPFNKWVMLDGVRLTD